jgi:hypothetical protein
VSLSLPCPDQDLDALAPTQVSPCRQQLGSAAAATEALGSQHHRTAVTTQVIEKRLDDLLVCHCHNSFDMRQCGPSEVLYPKAIMTVFYNTLNDFLFLPLTFCPYSFKVLFTKQDPVD